MKHLFLFVFLIASLAAGLGLFCPLMPVRAATLAERLSGRILLQVQDKGQAWYVNPVDLRRYSLGSQTNAYNLMRTLGLGITNANLARIPEYRKGGGDVNFARRFSGRILLQVEDKGKAWYISPVNLQRYYLGSPAQAYQLMRNLGLGITNANLGQIPIYGSSRVGFQKVTDSSLGNPQWGFGPAAGDFDEDGKTDVILLGHLGIAQIYRNLGSGQFQEKTAVSQTLMDNIPAGVNDVTVVDFNRDGHLDLFFCSADGEPTANYFTGDGHFNFTWRPITFESNTQPFSKLVFGDLNGDGWLDAVNEYPGQNGGSSIWLWNSRTKGFQKDEAFATVPQGVQPTLTDYDQDGDLDLMIGRFTNYGANPRVQVFQNNGHAQFSDVTTLVGLGSVAQASYDLNAADLNNDGRVDVLMLDQHTAVFENVGGRFTERTAGSGLPSGGLDAVAAFGDFNGDGLTDFVAHRYNGNFAIYENRGNFQFAKVSGFDDHSRLAAIADFTGDGKLDVVAQSTENAESMPGTYMLVNR